jgi:hypothetical protein
MYHLELTPKSYVLPPIEDASATADQDRKLSESPNPNIPKDN